MEILDALSDSDLDDSDADPDYKSSSSSSSEDETNFKGNKRAAPNTKAAPLAKKRLESENLLDIAEALPSTSSSKEVRVYFDPPEERADADTDIDSGKNHLCYTNLNYIYSVEIVDILLLITIFFVNHIIRIIIIKT